MSDRFYLTTPIYYVNDVPHIGHTYTTIVADVLARFHRMLGEEVRFLTGTDEHGQKIERAARQRGMEPIQLADEVVERFRSLWTTLGISNDDFIRTTEPRHHKGVEALFRRALDKGDIYKGKYEGWYCTSCESFFPENQVVDGLCPDQGHKVEWKTEEESYFFRLSRYQEPLLEHYRKHPGFVFPATRCNEVVAFVESGLRDLSISRSSLRWGIPFPTDPKHILYVWFDALSNYVTALDYGGDRKLYDRFWPADIHLVGKDILRFHAIYWPAYLMSAGLPLPKRIVAHGWWLRDAAKISKSRGGVVDPLPLIREFGIDPLRYFLMREMVFGQDANYSDEAFIERVNTDLANDLGNLASRSLKMIADYCDGVIPAPDDRFTAAAPLKEAARIAWDRFIEDFRALNFSAGLARVWDFVGELNRFIVRQEPWKAARDPDRRADLESTLYAAAEGLRIVARLIAPVVPGSAARLWKQLGMTGEVDQAGLGEFAWGVLKPGSRIERDAALFPRIDKAAYLKEARRSREVAMDTPEAKGTQPPADTAGAAAAPSPAPAPATSQIDIKEFGRLELRTARITAAERVEGADKLLKLTVDIGTESRTLVAGIALRYQPEALIGKTIVVVANLKPAKLRGVLSDGMLLAASDPEGQPYLLTTEEPVAPGLARPLAGHRMPVYSDSHAHLTFGRFDDDRDAVIARAREAGVARMITVASYLGDAERCAKLAAQHPSIHFTAGVHPHEAKRWDDAVANSLRGICRRPKLVAIGEIGLDYHYDHSPRDVQRAVFRKQIALARDFGLPIVLHTREAWSDTFTILEEEGAASIGGVFHCFSGGRDEALRCLDFGFYLSFAGPITFKNAGPIREAATCVPLDRLLTETDAPFLTPHPHRGKRNEPSHVVLIAQQIAALRGATPEEIGEATTRNLEAVFRLTDRVEGA